MGFWEDQWKQLRGHIKFRLLELAIATFGGTVLAALVYFLNELRYLPGWAPPLGVFLVSLSVFLYAIHKLSHIVQQPTKQAPPISKADQQSSKLVIHDAVWGPKSAGKTPGILDANITETLQGLTRDGLVVLASNNLVGDPAPNMKKRLRVEYSYGNSNRLTVEREEDSILVLPEDPYLKDIGSLFSPLQIEILRLYRDLRQMLRDAGPAPELRNGGLLVHEGVASAWMEEYSQWARKITYRYRGEFADRVPAVMVSLGQTTGMVVTDLEPYTKEVRPGYDFRQLLDLLLGFVVKLEKSHADHKAISALATQDEGIIYRYESLPLDEQRKILLNSRAKDFIDQAYERRNGPMDPHVPLRIRDFDDS
jgi:hypothetical protein